MAETIYEFIKNGGDPNSLVGKKLKPEPNAIFMGVKIWRNTLPKYVEIIYYCFHTGYFDVHIHYSSFVQTDKYHESSGDAKGITTEEYTAGLTTPIKVVTPKNPTNNKQENLEQYAIRTGSIQGLIGKKLKPLPGLSNTLTQAAQANKSNVGQIKVKCVHLHAGSSSTTSTSVKAISIGVDVYRDGQPSPIKYYWDSGIPMHLGFIRLISSEEYTAGLTTSNPAAPAAAPSKSHNKQENIDQYITRTGSIKGLIGKRLKPLPGLGKALVAAGQSYKQVDVVYVELQGWNRTANLTLEIKAEVNRKVGLPILYHWDYGNPLHLSFINLVSSEEYAPTTKPQNLFEYLKSNSAFTLVGKKFEPLPGLRLALGLSITQTVKYVEISNYSPLSYDIETAIRISNSSGGIFTHPSTLRQGRDDKILKCISTEEYSSASATAAQPAKPKQNYQTLYKFCKNNGDVGLLRNKNLKTIDGIEHYVSASAMAGLQKLIYIRVKYVLINPKGRPILGITFYGTAGRFDDEIYGNENIALYILVPLELSGGQVKNSQIKLSLRELQKENETRNKCIRCGNHTQEINLAFAIKKGCLSCEKELLK